MRGLIRNNVQILGLSSFFEDIDDYALMYRNVAGGAEKKRYNMILGTDSRDDEMRGIAKNVKAGYLVQKSLSPAFSFTAATLPRAVQVKTAV